MKKSILVLALLTISTLSAEQAQAADGFKFGYVDIQKVLFESQTGKVAINDVKVFQENRQREISRLEANVNDLEKDLVKQAFSITDEAKAIKEEDIRKKKLELKRLLEDSEYELAKRKREMLEAVNKDIVKIVKKLGKDENFDLILELSGSNIIYAGTSNDLTDRLIAELDKAAKPK